MLQGAYSMHSAAERARSLIMSKMSLSQLKLIHSMNTLQHAHNILYDIAYLKTLLYPLMSL